MDIKTVRQRSALAPRREPYWSLVAAGQHVGYRVTETGGHWIARSYDAATRQRSYRSLGDLRTIPDADRYSAAVREARKWFDHVSQGGVADVGTVGAAFGRYIERQRQRKGEAAAADANARFRRHVALDPIASIELTKLAARHLEAWHLRLSERGRSTSTLRRDLVSMRAALNLAYVDGHVTSNIAWRKSLQPPRETITVRREAYLTRDQRRAILSAIGDDHLRDFVTVLCLLPVRPGALAAVRVADFDARHQSFIVRTDKARAGRTVPLPAPVADIFKQGSRSKLPAAYLFTRPDGSMWTKSTWRKPFRDACEQSKLGPEITLYTLRHSTITDLVTGGLDVVSVAEIAGTSVGMIQKHYAHLQADRARDALSGLAL